MAVPAAAYPMAPCSTSSHRHRLFKGYEVLATALLSVVALPSAAHVLSLQVGVALAGSIENRFGRAQQVAGANFAEGLFHKWSLGTRECQAGILFVVETNLSQVRLCAPHKHLFLAQQLNLHIARQVYTYTGPGMATVIGAKQVKAAVAHMEADLRKEQLAAALLVRLSSLQQLAYVSASSCSLLGDTAASTQPQLMERTAARCAV